MSTLHDRIRAVVEGRLRIAREAGSTSRPSPRMAGRYADWHAEPYYNSEAETYSVVLQPPLGQIVPAAMEARIAAHIVANDPADAILGAEHALAVLERHRDDGTGMCSTCIRDTSDGEGAAYDCRHWARGYPCAEICDLATRWRVEVDG